MNIKAFVIFLTAGGTIISSQSASALIEGVGKGKARACYLAASMHGIPDFGIATCDQALAEESLNDRDRASTLVNRGSLEFAKGQNNAAMADFEAAIRLMPDQGDAYINRGVLLMSLNRQEDALADINQGITLSMSHPHLGYYNRAVVEDQLGRYQDAYRDYKHVLELEPAFSPASERLKNFIITKTPAPGSAS